MQVWFLQWKLHSVSELAEQQLCQPSARLCLHQHTLTVATLAKLKTTGLKVLKYALQLLVFLCDARVRSKLHQLVWTAALIKIETVFPAARVWDGWRLCRHADTGMMGCGIMLNLEKPLCVIRVTGGSFLKSDTWLWWCQLGFSAWIINHTVGTVSYKLEVTVTLTLLYLFCSFNY